MLAGRCDDLRPGKLAARQGSGRRSLNPALIGALNAAKEVLRDLGGKPMAADFAGMPFHVTVSDGEGTGSVAVAWWQPRTRAWRTRIVQAEVPTQWTRHWNASGHNITQIEACGPLLAFRTWPNLRNGLWIHFVDNEGAKFSMIKWRQQFVELVCNHSHNLEGSSRPQTLCMDRESCNSGQPRRQSEQKRLARPLRRELGRRQATAKLV